MSGPVQWSFLPAPALTSAPSRSATISTDGLYRYDLTRRWLPGDDWAVWVMLNPSTADADQDDPTIRRCIAFTKCAYLGGLAVVNLYAYRATDPKALAAAGKAGVDIVGPDNVQYLERWAAKARVFIAAWGAHRLSYNGCSAAVRAASNAMKSLRCLGKTQFGHPRHPLYVKSTQPLEYW